MFSRLRQRVGLVIFFISAMALVFGYGMAVEGGVFPHAIINSAIDSARDWKENWRHFAGVRSKWLRPTERTGGSAGATPERSWPGYTFFSGFHQGRWGAFLIGMKGAVVHEWPISLDKMWDVAGMPGEPAASQIENWHPRRRPAAERRCL